MHSHLIILILCICWCSSFPTTNPTDFPENDEETHLLDPDFIPRIEHKCKGNLVCFITSICNAENLICDSLLKLLKLHSASNYSITIVFGLMSCLLVGIIAVLLNRAYQQYRNNMLMRKIYGDTIDGGSNNDIFRPTTTTTAYSPMIPTEMFPLPSSMLAKQQPPTTTTTKQQTEIVKNDP
nr:hypothetical protein [Apis mellifera nudivirus]